MSQLSPKIGEPVTLPKSLSDITFTKDKKEGAQKSKEVIQRRQESFQRTGPEHGKKSGLSDVHGLYIPGAPSAVHSQQGEAINVPSQKSKDELKRNELDSRAEFEHRSIADARLHGKPVLAVCAGSWRLGEAYGGYTETLAGSELKKHHRPGEDTWKVGHDINITTPHTNLGGTMPKKNEHKDNGQPSTPRDDKLGWVNSTHWASVKANKDGTLTRAPEIPTPAPGLRELQNQSKLPTTPDELTVTAASGGKVEAFETRHGAPVIGVQWHPEAYLPGMTGREPLSRETLGLQDKPAEYDAYLRNHEKTVAQSDNLFKAFGQSAEAYRGRQEVNQEIKERQLMRDRAKRT
jgi:gamma-glutamyl-gamma-aminobutyrate hydrolase PuuD